MGYTTKHSRLNRKTKQILRPSRAKPITSILSYNSWKDRACYILAGGPSLHNFDFDSIKDELTIGINKAFTALPCTINYSMDPKFYNYISEPGISDSIRAELHQQWLDYKGYKVFLNNNSKRVVFDPSIYSVERLRKPILSLDISKGIYGGDNSGVGALMLAVALGACPIYLLGFDLQTDRETRASHWHKGYPKQELIDLDSKLAKFKRNFELIAPIIKASGIEVINLNENSALTCFVKKNSSHIRKVDTVRANICKEKVREGLGYDLSKLSNSIIPSPLILEKKVEFEKQAAERFKTERFEIEMEKERLKKEKEWQEKENLEKEKIRLEQSNTCPICLKSFKTPTGLKTHITRMHK